MSRCLFEWSSFTVDPDDNNNGIFDEHEADATCLEADYTDKIMKNLLWWRCPDVLLRSYDG